MSATIACRRSTTPRDVGAGDDVFLGITSPTAATRT
jgi:hypothetical protein